MKKIILLFSILAFIACENENEPIDISMIKNYIIMDPYEGIDYINIDLPDTVYYHFKENNRMTKIRLNYSMIDDAITLESKDTVECIYYADSNHLFMTVDWDNQEYLIRNFGKDNNEWVVLNPDGNAMEYPEINPRVS